jgi:hypothetical protein
MRRARVVEQAKVRRARVVAAGGAQAGPPGVHAQAVRKASSNCGRSGL